MDIIHRFIPTSHISDAISRPGFEKFWAIVVKDFFFQITRQASPSWNPNRVIATVAGGETRNAGKSIGGQ